MLGYKNLINVRGDEYIILIAIDTKHVHESNYPF